MSREHGLKPADASMTKVSEKSLDDLAAGDQSYFDADAGFAGRSPRISCCLRYHSRNGRDRMESLKSLKLAMFRAPSTSSFRALLSSLLASTDQPRNEPVLSFNAFAAAIRVS